MAMKTNDVVGLLVGGIVVIFLLFMIQKLATGIYRGIAWKGTPSGTLNNNVQNTAKTVTDSSPQRCSQAVINSVLLKNKIKPNTTSNPGFGALEGIIYGLMRCSDDKIVDSYNDPVAVGLFPRLTNADYDTSGFSNSSISPILSSTCGNSQPCYSFSNISPGSYTLLINKGDGWFCDFGSCSVTIQSGATTLFDMLTDR